jgi:hypothetical protein
MIAKLVAANGLARQVYLDARTEVFRPAAEALESRLRHKKPQSVN